MMNVKCPKCNDYFSTAETNAGKSEKCPNCGNICSVPPVPTESGAVAAVKTKSNSSLGIAALVFGCIALASSWIPFLGLLGVPMAVIGLLLGSIGLLVALLGRKSKLGLPVAGLFVSVLSIIIAVSSSGSAAIEIDEAMNDGTGMSLPSFGKQVVSYDAYTKLQNGMTYEQVVEIIGANGKELSKSSVDVGYGKAYDAISYQWMNGNGGNMIAIFENGKLTQKSQFGLD